MQAKAKLQVLDKPVRPVDATGQTAQTGLTGHETGLTAQTTGDTNLAIKDDAITKSQRSDLESSHNFLSNDFGHDAERNIRHIELKYVLIDSELYLWTAEYLFLKCLDSDQARVVIRKDHEGIGVYGNQFPRWSDCLEEPIFCPTMMSDCFK